MSTKQETIKYQVLTQYTNKITLVGQLSQPLDTFFP